MPAAAPIFSGAFSLPASTLCARDCNAARTRAIAFSRSVCSKARRSSLCTTNTLRPALPDGTSCTWVLGDSALALAAIPTEASAVIDGLSISAPANL